MPLELPTDTQHLRLDTRQYELFNRPLGQGISRRKMAIVAVIAVVWGTIMAVIGVDPLSSFGPSIYLFPVFYASWRGTTVDESGRMNLLVSYDWLLARLPHRRVVITNPLVVIPPRPRAPFGVDITAELHPAPPGGAPLPRLVGWSWRKREAGR